jgi:hypothetical protein
MVKSFAVTVADLFFISWINFVSVCAAATCVREAQITPESSQVSKGKAGTFIFVSFLAYVSRVPPTTRTLAANRLCGERREITARCSRVQSHAEADDLAKAFMRTALPQRS